MTQTNEDATPLDPKQVLRSMVKGYTGKDAPETATGTTLRELLRPTEDYKRLTARLKDEGLVLDEMMLQQVPNQEVQAWLINADHKKTFDGKVKGHGAQFLLPNGAPRFVDYTGPLPNAPPLLTEYVFPGVTILRNHQDGTEDYDFRGQTKPVQKNHGATPPGTSIQKAVDKAWRFNKKKGVCIGESYGHELLIGTISDTETDIRFFQPNEFNDKASLSYLARDGAGNTIEIVDDPAKAAPQLGISVDSPAKIWRTKLRGRPIAANGKLEVFRVLSDRAFGREGALADAAAEQGGRIVNLNDKYDANKSALKLLDFYNEKTNPHPYIQVGEKYVYRLESYTNREGAVTWKAYVRADAEHDNEGRALSPRLNCLVETMNRRLGGTFEKNEGAFVAYLGLGESRQASPAARGLLEAE